MDNSIYRDETHVGNERDLQSLATNIRHKKYGVDVRESIARSFEDIDNRLTVSNLSYEQMKQTAFDNGTWMNGVVDVSIPFNGDEETAANNPNSLYINGYVYKPGQVDSVLVYMKQTSDIKVYIYNVDTDKITANSKVTLNLLDVIETNATKGLSKVNVDKYIHSNFVIGIGGGGFAYKYQQGLTFTNNNYQNYEIGDSVPVNFTVKNTVVTCTGILYSDSSSKNIMPAVILDTTYPSYGFNSYPIEFNFSEKKLKINHIFLLNITNGKVKFTAQNSNFDLPELKDIKDYQSFFVAFSEDEKNIKIINFVGEANNVPLHGYKILAGISISLDASSYRSRVYFYNFNEDKVKVILREPTSSYDTNGHISNSENIPDYWTYNHVRNGLSLYTYISIGDSITAGSDKDNNYRPVPGTRYTDYIAQLTGLTCINMGISGSKIARIGSTGMVDRIPSSYYDVISIFGGTNDYEANVPLGDMSDSDMTHFIPAFNNILKQLCKQNGRAFVITPTKRTSIYPDRNKINLTLEDYVNAEIELCRKYGVPVLDLYHEFQYTSASSDEYKDKYMPDGLHPNQNGRKLLAQRISRFIETTFYLR